MNKLIFFFALILFFKIPVFAQKNQQIDFNNYKNIFAEGTIPEDFSSNTYTKINTDLKKNKTDLERSKEKIFLENIHYGVNDLLQSGYVIYGDEVTTYVNTIAKNLLKDEPQLQEELRFYTIKSNQTNAFSTFQGIIFVTTGLISQLSNEAQLAFILSHEIVHYQEKHVVESFDWKIKNKKNSDKIKQLSLFSKENEFEADKLALKFYNKAGYSVSELTASFDVLLYSYLPFDEQELTIAYFNNQDFTLPETYFSKNKFTIKAIEDADDTKSSHPNVKRRKEAVSNLISSYEKWGNEKFIFGQEKFNYIRNICRFESVRSDVLDGQFDDALYSIFCLEKEFPNSIYLKRMKAKSWLGIAQLKTQNLLNNKLPKNKEAEGEIANLQFVLRSLDKNQILGLSLRKIEDIRKENSSDTVIQLIWDRMVKTLVQNKKFDITKISAKNYQESLKEFYANPIHSDSLQTNKNSDENLTKYEKIQKSKKNAISKEVFDTTLFYYYGLSDLKINPLFIKTYDDFKQQLSDDKKLVEEYESLSSQEKKKIKDLAEKNQLRTGESSLIFVEPLVMSYDRHGVNRVKSEKLAENFANGIHSVSKQLDMDVTTISSARLVDFETNQFNERAILTAYLDEIVEFENIEVFPTDYLILQDIQNTYHKDKVMFSLLQHSYELDLNPAAVVLYTVIFCPITMVYVPTRIIKGNETDLKVIIIDLKKGEIMGSGSYNYNDPLNKYTMKARIYDILSQVKSKPVEK